MLSIAVCISLCCFSCCGYNAIWRKRVTSRAEVMSQMIKTPQGPVEVSVKGKAPYMLAFFGTPSIHDGVYGLFDEFQEAGFGIVCPSRPGYGRTPLSSGKTYKEQPDLYAAMLDKLGIDKVVVHSISGGGPAAYYFARQYPDRCYCLMPECSVSGNLNHVKLESLYKWHIRLAATSVASANATQIADPAAVVKGMLKIENTPLTEEELNAFTKDLMEDPRRRKHVDKINKACEVLPSRSYHFDTMRHEME